MSEEENNPIEDARKLLTEINAANEETKLLIIEQKKLATEQMKLVTEQILSGRSAAGQTPVPPKEETPVEYKNRIMRNGK